MAEPTPGPWQVFTNRHPTTDGRQWGCVVAVPHPAGGAGKLPTGMKIYWEGPEGRANARLIAAVTDLLAAAVAAEIWIHNVAKGFGVTERELEAAHPLPMLHAAIAKARGLEAAQS